MGVTEEGVQRVTGMDILLNAPLHSSQQKHEESFMINRDAEDDCGEKTVLFPADNASMDMTHSHTIIISNDEELQPVLPDQQDCALPTYRNMDLSLCMEKKNSDTYNLPKNKSMHDLDPEFENFLASLSKPSGPRGNSVMAKVMPTAVPFPQETVSTSGFQPQLKTQRYGADKENQAPASMSMMQKPSNKPRTTRESSAKSVNYSEGDVSMDMTEAITGSIVENTLTNEPLKCLFSTQHLQQESTEALGYPSSNPWKAEDDSDDMEFTSCQTRIIEARNLDTVKHLPSFGTVVPVGALNANKNPAEDNPGMGMAAGQGGDTKYNNYDDMELTRSQTFAIDAKTIHALSPLQNNNQKSLAFLRPSNNATNTLEVGCDMDLTKVFTESIDHISHSDRSRMPDNPLDWLFPKMDNEKGTSATEADSNDMELTRCQTRVIEAKHLDTRDPLSFGIGRPVSILDSNKKLVSEDDNSMDMTAHKGEDTKYHNCDSDNMEITRSQTVAIDAKSLNVVKPMHNKKRKSLAFMTFSSKTSDTSEVKCDMGMSRVLPESVDHVSQSGGPGRTEKLLDNLFPKTQNIGTKNMPEADPDDMEFTRCQTRVIEAKHLGTNDPLNFGTGRPVNVLDSNKKLISEDDNGIDRSAHHGKDTKYHYCESDNMEITRSQTVAIDTTSLNAVKSMENKNRKSLAFVTFSAKAGDTSEVKWEMGRSHIFPESVDHMSQSDGTKITEKLFDNLLSKTQKMGTEDIPEADPDDMEFTRCQTRVIEAKHLGTIDPLNYGTGRPVSDLDSNKKLISEDVNGIGRIAHQEKDTEYHNCESDNMEITRSQTVAIDAKSLSAVKSMENKNQKSLAFVTFSTKASDTSVLKCDMEMTHIFPESVDLILQSDGSGMTDKHWDNLLPKTHEMGTSDIPEADPDGMEFTRCQTRVIEAKIIDVIRTSEPGEEGSVVIPNSSTKYLAEGNSGMEMTQALSTAKSSQNRSRFSHIDKTVAKVSTTAGAGVEDSNLSEMGHTSDQLTCQSDDMELTSNRVCRDYKITGFMNQVLHKEKESFSSLHGKIPNLREANTQAGVSKASHNKENGTEAHVVDGMHNIPDECAEFGDMDITREKIIPVETNQGTVNSFPTSVLSDDNEKRVTKVNTSVSTKSAQQVINAHLNASASLPPPECRFDNQTNFTESLDSKEIESKKDPELRNENSPLSKRLENSPSGCPATYQVDNFSSRNAQNRRKSLADLQSKLRRISHMMFEANDNNAIDSYTVPLPQVENSLEKNSIKTKSERNLGIGCMDNEDNTHHAEQPCTAALSVKAKHPTSRLSMVDFMPKLPKLSKPEPNKVESSHVDFTHQLNNETQMYNIDDEVFPNISSDEDLSETIETKTERSNEKESPLKKLKVDEPLEDMCEEPVPNVVQGKKRPLPDDHLEDHVDDEKRRRPSSENTVEMGLQSQVVDCDSNITAAPGVITQSMDAFNYSSTTNVRCEATFESTRKQSLFESQLEDNTSDIQKKLDDDDITVLEFFKLFNLDFIIHKPRQSVLPGRLASDLDRRPNDLLRDRHINHPKQRVYEADLQNLIDKVEGLKAQMKDGEKLKNVNRSLWEEMSGLSEKELKCFGAKLKERSNFFRKRSKVQSHEMKEVLYSNLVQANLEEQQKLQGKIEEADEMLKSLDDCIHELENELAAVEGKGLEDSKPTLKSNQLGLNKVTHELADDERQMCELEMQKKHNLDKLNKLRTEAEDLENHITVLHWLNEWKFSEKWDNGTVYTFLFESLHLMLMFENGDGNDAEDNSEQKISDITLKIQQLDDETPQSHAHLVHRLLSQYFEGKTDWVKKYPTSRCVPTLLHDVSLVVSRCRLLGEEVRLLKMWGGLRLDLLDISCVDTQIRVLFSNLKAFSKFEFSLAVTPSYPHSQLQVQNFKSYIGNTTVHQIEEVVSSVTPSEKYLTRIVKRIHDTLL
uniref:Knl1 C-terminal RWD domain-containing protein n=2 Tax=Myripristis murdjan TaxID=586833 RepID=A0A667YYG5_9TELE